MDLSFCGNKVSFLDRYKGNVALNVKHHGYPVLSPATSEILANLDGAVRKSILRFAEEAIRESWWVSMQERARELTLGDLWSDGRSGGWLVFKMTISHLEELIEEAEKACAHCTLAFETHVDSKCPFQASSFQPERGSVLALLEAFRTFSEEVRASLNTVGDTFEQEIIFQLENLDDYGTPGVSAPHGGSEKSPAAFEEHADE